VVDATVFIAKFVFGSQAYAVFSMVENKKMLDKVEYFLKLHAVASL